MKKTNLIQFNNNSKDIQFWIKHYLCEKIMIQKVDAEYIDKKEEGEINRKYFDRSSYCEFLKAASNEKELQDQIFKIRRNGLKKLATFSVPLFHLLNYLEKKDNKDTFCMTEINEELISIYIEDKYSDYSDWTRKGYFTQIKGFFKFINKYSIRENNELFNIKKCEKGMIINNPKSSNDYLDAKSFNILLNSIDTYKTNHPCKAQPKLLMQFFCLSGLNINELRNIKIINLSFETIEDLIYSKIIINENKIVYINYDTIKNNYEIVLNEKNTEIDFLFYNRKEIQYAEKSMYDIVNRFFNNADIKKPYSSQQMKRSNISMLLKKGIKPKYVSMILALNEKEFIEFINEILS